MDDESPDYPLTMIAVSALFPRGNYPGDTRDYIDTQKTRQKEWEAAVNVQEARILPDEVPDP